MIEVGDYVRTNDGIIGKIKRIELDNIDKSLKWYVFDWKRPDINIIKEVYKNKPYITKYSKNLIDLIEVRDIVFIEDLAEPSCLYIYSKEMLQALNEEVRYGAKITSVLTHENFRQNCYEVGGEE